MPKRKNPNKARLAALRAKLPAYPTAPKSIKNLQSNDGKLTWSISPYAGVQDADKTLGGYDVGAIARGEAPIPEGYHEFKTDADKLADSQKAKQDAAYQGYVKDYYQAVGGGKLKTPKPSQAIGQKKGDWRQKTFGHIKGYQPHLRKKIQSGKGNTAQLKRVLKQVKQVKKHK
jgi:hypothetical protein